jgi:hypothetical protein
VNKVIDAPPGFLDLDSNDITIVFTPGSVHKNGEQQVFYTYGWYYGNTLGVIEVKNNLNKKFQIGLKQQIQQARLQILDDSLAAELKRSTIVIRGVVKKIEEVPEVEALERSEHNPRLYRATFDIQETLKGKKSQDSLSVFYSSSYDLMWIRSPKLSKGLEGIFLLRKAQLPKFFKLNGYTALDERDYQTNEKLKKVKSLLLTLHK